MSVHLQWETLVLIGHISPFFGTVDLVAKVSCQKTFVPLDQPVAALTMADCSLQFKPHIQTLTSGTNLPAFFHLVCILIVTILNIFQQP